MPCECYDGTCPVGDRFDPLLTPGEVRLRDALLGLAALGTGPDAESVHKSVAWPWGERLLKGLGFTRDGN